MKRKRVTIIAAFVFGYILLFLLCWEMLLRGWASNRIVFLGFPAAAGIYFEIAGAIVRRYIPIRRRCLWLWLNAAGYPFCWLALTIRIPLLWTNLMILFFFLITTLGLILVWGLVAAAVFFRRWLIKKRKGATRC